MLLLMRPTVLLGWMLQRHTHTCKPQYLLCARLHRSALRAAGKYQGNRTVTFNRCFYLWEISALAGLCVACIQSLCFPLMLLFACHAVELLRETGAKWNVPKFNNFTEPSLSNVCLTDVNLY